MGVKANLLLKRAEASSKRKFHVADTFVYAFAACPHLQRIQVFVSLIRLKLSGSVANRMYTSISHISNVLAVLRCLLYSVLSSS